MSFEKPAVVIDNGSYSIKAGFACDNHPVAIFRTLIGRPNYLRGTYGREYYHVFVGDDVADKAEELEVAYPVVNGKIVNWDNMERIWHNVFYKELKVAPEDRAVILACGSNANMDEKFKCCEVFFEALNAPAICIQPQCVLAMYGSGSTTGICVDLGHDSSEVTPIFEGGMIRYAQINTGLAGSQISDYVKKSLKERGAMKYIKLLTDIEEIKKSLYLTTNCAMSIRNYTRKYKLPNDDEIIVTNESFMGAELIFQPNLVKGKSTEYVPLHEAIVKASLKCDKELRTDLYNSIVLCGGLAMIPGFYDRLQLELDDAISSPFTIHSSSEPYAISWLGGATFAGLSDAEKMWIHKKQFEDHGARIVKNKFL